FDWEIPAGVPFSRYQPEVWIGGLNQALFFAAIFLAFRLAKRLFDSAVAWISILVLAGSDVFWRFSVSGLSTLLLVVIFLGLVWCLVLMEQAAQESKRSSAWFFLMAGLSGALAGAGALTRYSFGWLIVPALVFVAAHLGPCRLA